MNNRNQLNQQHYQQSLQFAEHYPDGDKQQLIAEIEQRHQFEQSLISQTDLQKNSKTRPVVLVLFGLFIVFVVSGIFYWQTGRYQQVQQGQQAFNQFQQQNAELNSIERNNRYIETLQNHLRQNPNNGEVWFELGQAYSLNNDFKSALICFTNAQTVLGKTPAILGAMATVDYYQHKQHLTEQAKEWINDALSKDPKESASLLILASEAFLKNDYKQAIDRWQSALDSGNQSIDRRAIIQSIQMAERMAR
ncbi:cytochrome C biogenesis protein [Pasteurellaceae bacterium LFhippo2]|nr:cytochrome C biogenesis protein [Pasteurellaceae bacterium LFhippo2]